MNYNNDDYSQAYGQIKNAFRALPKGDIFQPYIFDNDFRSSNDVNDTEYNLYVFDVRYQKNIEPPQPVKVEFKFSENVPAGIYGYALVLTTKLVSIGCDGRRHFDLT